MQTKNLKNLLAVFSQSDNTDSFQIFAEAVAKLKNELQQKIEATSLNEVNGKLSDFQKKIDFKPLVDLFEAFKKELLQKNTQFSESLIASLEERVSALNQVTQKNNLKTNFDNEASRQKTKQEIENLTAEIAVLSARKIDLPDFGKQIKDTETKLMAIIDTAKTLDTLEDEKENEALQVQFVNFERQIKELKLALQHRGGGSMNRKISINGTAVSTRYTDINFKGSGVTYLAVDNNTTKEVDLTLTSTGGGIAGTSNYELPLTGAIDDNNAAYTFTHTPQDILLNGAIQIPGGIDITVVGTTVTFVVPPATDSTLYNKYLT